LVGACTGKSPGCGYSHGHTLANQIGRKLRQSIELPVSRAKFERNVLAFDVSGLLEALAKSAQILREGSGDVGCRNPITGIAACCALATSGHAAAAPTLHQPTHRSGRGPLGPFRQGRRPRQSNHRPNLLRLAASVIVG
jgi:hypothetical protein